MLNREVYAPTDLVAGLPPGDLEHYESADDFVVQQQRMARDVYASVREHLQVAASRGKWYYDIRVKDRDFQPGKWVWYYYPRRVAEDVHWTIPNCFGAAAVERRAAKIQEEFTVPPALRQAQSLPWHGTSRLAAYDEANRRRSGRRQHPCCAPSFRRASAD